MVNRLIHSNQCAEDAIKDVNMKGILTRMIKDEMGISLTTKRVSARSAAFETIRLKCNSAAVPPHYPYPNLLYVIRCLHAVIARAALLPPDLNLN